MTANSSAVSLDQNSCFFISLTVSSTRIASFSPLYPRNLSLAIVFPL